MFKKRSFLERLSGSIRMKDDEEFEDIMSNQSNSIRRLNLDDRREPQRGEERNLPRGEKK